MTRERWFLGDEREAWFDWQRSARDLDIPLDLARDLYLRATQRTVDTERAEQLYRGWMDGWMMLLQPRASRWRSRRCPAA